VSSKPDLDSSFASCDRSIFRRTMAEQVHSAAGPATQSVRGYRNENEAMFRCGGSVSDLRQPSDSKLPAPCSRLSFSAGRIESVTIAVSPTKLTDTEQKAINDAGEAADKAGD
jgi:hypothetical protein